MTTSALGLSFGSIDPLDDRTMFAVARTVIVLLVLLATICGCDGERRDADDAR